eukprot:gb/GECH01008495.1/.p1 GENE.gb/GECH01008495.1/~~gb/GECH01008495.1/.p1  ORF type:complete len:1371 (+),score=208.87 gb/GECH01008495.1/:1-4113(+)
MTEQRTVSEICQKIESPLSEGNLVEKPLSEDKLNQVFTEFKRINTSNFERELRNGVDSKNTKLVIACCMFAIQKHLKHTPRVTQIASVMLFVTKRKTHGRLLEVKTGEGKGDIVAMTAATQALMEKCKVDVVTSSEVLAQRDAKLYKSFFSDLGLHVGNNINFYEDFMQERTLGNVYQQCDILYGVTSSFCGDYLKDVLGGNKITERQKAFLIADEVDNMLVDNKDFITKLSGTEKGLLSLRKIRQRVWRILNVIRFSPKQESMSEEELHLAVKRDMTHELENNSSLKIKPFYKDLGLLLLPKWINSAIHAAFHCRKNVRYIIENQKIVIINQDTGVKMARSRWQNGLHEFLELKHGLPLGSDSFTSMYYSSLRFYTNYKAGLCGLTGTVGSVHTCKFLAKTYEVDIFKVPTFRPSLRKDLKPIVCSTQDEVLQNIGENTIDAYMASRPSLVIVESIGKVHSFKKKLEHQCRLVGINPKIIKYIDSDAAVKDTSVLDNIDEHTVVIATNLAGRGTDISINDAINDRGGLRVILGYFPKSLRVEQQAFGRTARKGQNGDCLMVSMFEGFKPELLNVDMILKIRDEIEKNSLQGALKEVEQKRAFDHMFQKITELMDDEEISLREDQALLKSMRERWGIFLLEQELKLEGEPKREYETMMKEFDTFWKKLCESLSSGNLSENITHSLHKIDQLLRADRQDEAGKLLEEIKEHATTGYHFRKAMIQNNKGNFISAESHVNKLFEACQHHVCEWKVNSEIDQNLAIATDSADRLLSDDPTEDNPGVEKIDGSTLEIPNPVAEEEEESTPAADATETSKKNEGMDHCFDEIKTVLEENTKQEIQDYLGSMQKIAQILMDVIETNLKNKENPDALIKLRPDVPEKMPENPIDDEVIKDPEPIEPPEKDKKTGILGFVIGAIEIITGAALTIFSGGLVAAFGINLIIDGIDLINLNIEMNREGTYNTDDIVKKAVKDCLKSIALTPLTASVGYIAPMMNKFTEAILSRESSESIAAHIEENHRIIQMSDPPPTPTQKQKAIENGVESALKKTKNEQLNDKDFRNCSDAQKQRVVNDRLQRWFDSNVKERLSKISPQNLESFRENVDALVSVELKRFRSQIEQNNEMKRMLALLSLIKANKKEFYTEQMNFVERFARPSKTIPDYRVLEKNNGDLKRFESVDLLSDMDDKMSNIMTFMNKMFQAINKLFAKNLRFIIESNLSDEGEALRNYRENLRNDIDDFVQRSNGNREQLERRSRELNRRTETFNNAVENYPNFKFEKLSRGVLGDLLLNKLQHNRNKPVSKSVVSNVLDNNNREGSPIANKDLIVDVIVSGCNRNNGIFMKAVEQYNAVVKDFMEQFDSAARQNLYKRILGVDS